MVSTSRCARGRSSGSSGRTEPARRRRCGPSCACSNSTPAPSPGRPGRSMTTSARQFGYMPAERGMYPRMRVRDHLVYYGRLSGQSARAAAGAADVLAGAARAGRPGGQRRAGPLQRQPAARATGPGPAHRSAPSWCSTNRSPGLDPVAVDMLSDILRERVADGAALLLSSHQLDLVADVCSSVVIVDARPGRAPGPRRGAPRPGRPPLRRGGVRRCATGRGPRACRRRRSWSAPTRGSG